MLTQLQRDAMTRAQAGDWSLADAMEPLAEGRQWHNGSRLLGGYRGTQRVRMFVYGHRPECEECAGGGTLSCGACDGAGDFACEACDTAGTVVCPLCEQACLTEPGIACPTCDSTRQVPCTDCNATGREKCAECTAGDVECDECDGCGGGEETIDYVLDMNERVIYSDADDEDGDGPPAYADFTREQAEKILHAYHNPPKPAPAARAAVPTQSTLLGDLAA